MNVTVHCDGCQRGIAQDDNFVKIADGGLYCVECGAEALTSKCEVLNQRVHALIAELRSAKASFRGAMICAVMWMMVWAGHMLSHWVTP